MHFHPEDIDWSNFFEYAQEEITRHARKIHRREADAEDLPTDT